MEVFERRWHHLCYRIGKMNTADVRVEWRSEQTVFASGKRPCVALNRQGIAVVIYQRGTLRKDLYGQVGSVDEPNGVILWSGREKRLLNGCWRASVSLNDANDVVIGFTSTSAHSFATGRINAGHGTTMATASGPSRAEIESTSATKHGRASVSPEPYTARSSGLLTGIIELSSILSVSSHSGERQSVPFNHHIAMGLNNFGHLVSARIVNREVVFYNGRLENHKLLENTLQRSEARLSNIAHKVRSSSISVNNDNLVAVTWDIAHGLLNRKKVVFTVLGKLAPHSSTTLHNVVLV